MLRAIHIKDFAIIENLNLELEPGMTVITGETGAGKSIVIDALDIALGDKANSQWIRHGAERCEINIEFDITYIPKARTWLANNDLDNDNECIIRRLLSVEGRGRNYINGSPVNLSQLRELGSLLVNIHGQHQHQALVKLNEQRELLDNYAGDDELLQKVRQTYNAYKKIQNKIDALTEQTNTGDSQKILLEYQLNELDALALEDDELDSLHVEHRQLANAEQLIKTCHQALEHISEGEEYNATSLMNAATHAIDDCKALDYRLNNACELVNNAIINLEEAEGELKHYLEQIDLNPERLQVVDQRLSQIHELARKHKIAPENILQHHESLTEQYILLSNASERLIELEQEQKVLWQEFIVLAEELSQLRKDKAEDLNDFITESMQNLGMQGGVFAIDITEAEPSQFGIDKVAFYVTANPGQPLQPLSKVASGGELSRIGLAIQVITAKADATPTLVFDEVDVGIGGHTAAIVGELLRQLGETAQVICITHLPQVASYGHHHLKIAKESDGVQTHSDVRFLNKKERTQEIARMLGGVKVTEQTLAHAAEMLTLSV